MQKAPQSQAQEKPKPKAMPKVEANFGKPGNISKEWPKIVTNLKNNGKIVLYTNLVGTQATELNDITVGIQFNKEITPFGKAVLEKQENVKEVENLVSNVCGKPMQVKYIENKAQKAEEPSIETSLQDIANASDIPFNIID